MCQWSSTSPTVRQTLLRPTIRTGRSSSTACGSVTKNVALEPTSIPGLFNTGVDACGNPLADGTIGDPHYELIAVPSGTTDIRVRTLAGGYPVPPYIPDNPDSAWIGPNGD